MKKAKWLSGEALQIAVKRREEKSKGEKERYKHLNAEFQRPFRYDLNQILYDYTAKVTNRFKRLDLIECLKNYGQRFVTLYRRQGSRPSPWKRNAKSKMAVWGGLTQL